ncbi:MAG: cobalt transporter CbiM [Firmicutes bacterium]|nr:cobalt transporter CbiM [Bacillota bacterium]
MHIPDGYLSPQTCGILAAAVVPFWVHASRKVRSSLSSQQLPLLGLAAAFTFVVMMFNIPVPDGTTAHATGIALVAILLGPWAALVAASVALVIQAVIFGDGGIWALGANIFNMGVVLPLVAYGVFASWSKLGDVLGRTSNQEANPQRTGHGWGWQIAGAALAGYISINAAALVAAVEFGLQPLLFALPDGTPLYCPYGLGQAIPAMAFAHLVMAGPAEALVTAAVLAYLTHAHPEILPEHLRRGGPGADIPPAVQPTQPQGGKNHVSA